MYEEIGQAFRSIVTVSWLCIPAPARLPKSNRQELMRDTPHRTIIMGAISYLTTTKLTTVLRNGLESAQKRSATDNLGP